MFIAPRKSPRSSQTPSATFSSAIVLHHNAASVILRSLGLPRALRLESLDHDPRRLPRGGDGDRDRPPGRNAERNPRRRLPGPAGEAARITAEAALSD